MIILTAGSIMLIEPKRLDSGCKPETAKNNYLGCGRYNASISNSNSQKVQR